MKHTAHRFDKIIAVALGWTLGNLLLKASLTSFAQLLMIFLGQTTEQIKVEEILVRVSTGLFEPLKCLAVVLIVD